MTMKQQWTELADAFRAATGPDRELDARLALACGLPQAVFGPAFGSDYVDGPDLCGPALWAGGGRRWEAPRFSDTLHIGQTIKLLGEVLPEAEMRISSNKMFSTALVVPLGTAFTIRRRGRDDLALALCEAICRAKTEVG